jgi:hypothetical protein
MLASGSSSKVSESSSHHKDGRISQERRPAKKRILMVKILNDKHCGILETFLSESVKELPYAKRPDTADVAIQNPTMRSHFTEVEDKQKMSVSVGMMDEVVDQHKESLPS